MSEVGSSAREIATVSSALFARHGDVVIGRALADMAADTAEAIALGAWKKIAVDDRHWKDSIDALMSMSREAFTRTVVRAERGADKGSDIIMAAAIAIDAARAASEDGYEAITDAVAAIVSAFSSRAEPAFAPAI